MTVSIRRYEESRRFLELFEIDRLADVVNWGCYWELSWLSTS